MNNTRRLEGKAVTLVHRRVRDSLRLSGLIDGARLVVSVSGGPDSLALLYSLLPLCDSMGLHLHGAHLDHRLRGAASDADAAAVRDTFGLLEIQATVRSADVEEFRHAHGLSLEDAARRVRYEFLAAVAAEQRADAVALGHTADDQAETVLMHILRGSGLSGLRGMEPATSRIVSGEKLMLVRPLLDVSRRQTAAYCAALGLEPRFDESNLSRELTRNRIRLDLIPQLETYNPAVRDALLRLSRTTAKDIAYIDGAVAAVWDDVATQSGPGVTLRRGRFSELAPAIQGHVLRKAMLAVKGDLTDVKQIHIDDMARLMTGPAGKALDLPGGVSLEVSYRTARLHSEDPSVQSPLTLEGDHRLEVPGETKLARWLVSSWVIDSPRRTRPEPDGSKEDSLDACLDYDSLGGGLSVRPRAPGDQFQPLGMEQAKKLQDFMVDAKIPRSLRDQIPLVVSPRGIVWVVGYRIADWARITDKTARQLQLRFGPNRVAVGCCVC